jgi:hypothetical protein
MLVTCEEFPCPLCDRCDRASLRDLEVVYCQACWGRLVLLLWETKE